MTMRVSVIMPVYNAAPYIENAIQSLLSQTNPNWKLICIDDGSTDNSKEIINSFINKDNRISLICQENAGPAVARARAIALVDTEYISILDSDDAYSSDYIELMLKRAETTKADTIVPDVEFRCNNIKQLNMFDHNQLSSNLIINNGIEAFSMTIPWKLHGWQMVKTELAKKYYTIENASYSKFNSDEYITRLLYLKSNKVALCKAKYIYRITPNSLTRTASLKKLDYLKTLEKLLNLCKDEHIDNKVLVRLYNNYYSTIKSSLRLIPKLKPDEKDEAKRIIRYYYRTSYIPHLTSGIIQAAKFTTKVKFIISKVGLIFFKLL